MRRTILTALLALAVAAALPAAASAHSTMGQDGDTLVYLSVDAISLNTLTVVLTADRVRFRDPTVDGGIDPGTVCDPGEVNEKGWVVEVICRREGVGKLRIDVADREDSVTVREAAGVAPIPTHVLGGVGADKLTGGLAADQLEGGSGEDVLDGRGGDDELFARDGARDRVSCGEGNDRAEIDAADEADATCEAIDRAEAPPGGDPGSVFVGNDSAPPLIEGGALTLQRVRTSGALRIMATASEPAELAASGTLDVGALRFPLAPARAQVRVSGGGVTLRLRMPRSARRSLRRLFARRRQAVATVTVVATDAAGNSSATRLPRIRLSR